MYLARIQDSNQEPPETSLQAVTESLKTSQGKPSPDDFLERLFRLGYAVIPIKDLPGSLIFKGKQA